MSNFDCPNCDDPACNVAELRHRVRTKKLNTVALTSLASEYNRAKDACQSKTVNWRARALTEAARADSAEARALATERALIGVALYAEKSSARPYDPAASEWKMGVNEATVGIGQDLLRLIRPYTEMASIAFAAEMRRCQP